MDLKKFVPAVYHHWWAIFGPQKIEIYFSYNVVFFNVNNIIFRLFSVFNIWLHITLTYITIYDERHRDQLFKALET